MSSKKVIYYYFNFPLAMQTEYDIVGYLPKAVSVVPLSSHAPGKKGSTLPALPGVENKIAVSRCNFDIIILQYEKTLLVGWTPIRQGFLFWWKNMIIYMAVNKINNKKYIGQTVRKMDERKSEHLYNARNGCMFAFHCAIRKYGVEGFEWKKLYHAKSIKELNDMETYYISAYVTHKKRNGYNVALGGGNRRTPLSVRKKMSAAHKGKKNPMYGKKLSFEHRKKLGEARRGEKNHFFGKKHSEESIAKMCAVKTGEKNPRFGKKHSNETKKKMSAALKGKTHSIKAREKMIGTHIDPTIYTFHHPEYGIAWCTKYALRKEFSLHDSALAGVAAGSRKSHKGWRIASPEYIQELKKRNEGVSCN